MSITRQGMRDEIRDLKGKVSFETVQHHFYKNLYESTARELEAARKPKPPAVPRFVCDNGPTFAVGGYVEPAEVRIERTVKGYETLLDDILLLEPHLKHYQTDGRWDRERIHRAAEHVRGEEALESLGFTPLQPDLGNVAFIDDYRPAPEGGAA